MSRRGTPARPDNVLPDEVAPWLDALGEPAFVIARRGRKLALVHANRALCQSTGCTLENLTDNGFQCWLDPPACDRLQRSARLALATGRARCRSLDGLGGFAELRRVRWRRRDFCLGILRLGAGMALAVSRDELKHRDDLLATALDLESMAAWSWDRKTNEIRAEYRAPRADFMRLPSPNLDVFLDRLHRDDRVQVWREMQAALRRPGIHHLQFRYIGDGSVERWISSAFQRYVDASGRPAGLVGTSRDISARKAIFRDLAESEERLRSILAAEPECVKIVDREGRLQSINPAGLAVIEADGSAQVIGLPVLDIVAPEHRDAFSAFHLRVLSGRTESLEFEMVGLRGTRRWVESKAAPLRDASGAIVGQLAVTRDVTERRALSREIIEAANREQERIGRDLHDGLGQELTGVALMLKGLKGQLHQPLPELEREVEEILGVVRDALQNTRTLARGLSPVAIERGGLAGALRALAHWVRETTRLQVRYTARSTAAEPLDNAIALQLYRIAQEATSNALRHAGATRLNVSLTLAPGRARLRVADDGKGVSRDRADPAGLGLRTMEYRAQLIGGVLRIQPAAAGGTVVVVDWPAVTAAREQA